MKSTQVSLSGSILINEFRVASFHHVDTNSKRRKFINQGYSLRYVIHIYYNLSFYFSDRNFTSQVFIMLTQSKPTKIFIAPKLGLEISLLTLNQRCKLFRFIVCDKHWAFDIHVIQPMSPGLFHYVCPQPSHMLQTLSVLATLLGTTSITCNDTKQG
jgi:hypothetical protein